MIPECRCPTCGCLRPSKLGEGVMVDVARRLVTHGDRTAKVTPIMALVAQRLAAARPGHAVSKYDLIDHIYGDRGMPEPRDPERLVYVTIYRLRRRLAAIKLNIVMEIIDGYRLEATP